MATETGRVKVLVNALHAKSGGGATYMANMLPRLGRSPALEVHAAVGPGGAGGGSGDGPEGGSGGGIEGVALHRMERAPKGVLALAAFEQIRIPALARSLGADVVFSPANFGPLFTRRGVVMLRNAMGAGFLARRPGQAAYWAALYAATLTSMAQARRVIAVSGFAKASGGRLIERLIEKKCDIIPHGVSGAFSPDESVRRGNFVLCVSDLYVQKNLEALLDAAAILKWRGIEVPIRIAGAPLDRKYADSLKMKAEQLGLTDRVTFMGRVTQDELIKLYRTCRLFVFPSVIETFGNPLLEAMACGAPVVSSNTAAMPEIARGAALYADPRNPDALAGLIAALWSNHNRRAVMSRASVKRAGVFSWDTAAERTIQALRAAAGG
ncbi:MAG: glycosyltransferase family 4 protein [Rhodospirillales bacterium]